MPPLTAISGLMKPTTGSEKTKSNWIGLVFTAPPDGVMVSVGAVVSKSQVAVALARLSLPPTKSAQVAAASAAETRPGADAVTRST